MANATETNCPRPKDREMSANDIKSIEGSSSDTHDDGAEILKAAKFEPPQEQSGQSQDETEPPQEQSGQSQDQSEPPQEQSGQSQDQSEPPQEQTGQFQDQSEPPLEQSGQSPENVPLINISQNNEEPETVEIETQNDVRYTKLCYSERTVMIINIILSVGIFILTAALIAVIVHFTSKIFAEELYNTQRLDDSKIVKFKNSCVHVNNEDNENTISNINQIGSTQNSNVSETNPKVVQYMTSDCVETESKLAHSMTSINTDTVITSTPSRQSPDTNELLLDFNTLSPININHHKSVNLQEEIFELKKTVCHLMNLINNKPIVTDKGTQVTTCDASTQTDDFKITTKPEIKSIGTQIHPNSKDSAMQTSPPEVHSKNVERCIQSTPDVKNISKSHSQDKKGKSHGNGSQHQKIHRNYNNNNILVIGSSLLKSINTKDLNNTSVSTNRGARIVDIINIVKDKDIRQYESIIVHIGGNDISNGATLNLIQENYESLLYLLRSKADMNTNIIVSSVPQERM
ncbi:unnamed protein product [Mytilus coruscus]|uniref:Uncharacterized protein n=1 Tax=Mytilus coruscus TaxID=42192 RepID=A0A6J8A8L4_MYTCO|nr:unnamed protein product [Mytilus coruscus]